MNAAVILPARNEQDCLADTLRRIPAGFAAQLIVVDNGSADGSDDPAALPRLLAPIAAGEADLVIGARTAGDARQHLTPQQRFGNALAGGLIRLGWGHRYADLGPLRVIRRDALAKLRMNDRTWGWTVEMQIKAVQAGLRIRELPVPYRPRLAGQSKIAGTLTGSVRAGTKILATIGRQWWAARAQSLLMAGLVIELAGLSAMLPYGDFRQPGAAMFFLLEAAIAVTGYALACAGAARAPVAWGWAVAIGFRLLLLPMAPSDDIWRYLWEGKIQNLRFNPYLVSPASEALRQFRDGYWPWINHPTIPALYPPATELVFRLLAAIGYHPLLFKLAFAAWLAAAILCKLAFVVALPFYLVTARRKVWSGLLAGGLMLAAVGLAMRVNGHPWVAGQEFARVAALYGVGALVILVGCRCHPVEGTLGMLGWTLMVSPAFHPWYVPWVLCLAPLARGKAWWALSVSAFAYFWLWTRVTEGGRWAFTTHEKLVIWLQVYLVLALELGRRRWRRNS